jgi:hypothetical protein
MRISLLALPLLIAGAFVLGRATAPGAAPAATNSRVYTGRAGDVFRVSAAATRCFVSQEGGSANTTCRHTPLARARYSLCSIATTCSSTETVDPMTPSSQREAGGPRSQGLGARGIPIDCCWW